MHKLNIYRTMAHHPALMAAWAPLREHVVKDTVLGQQFSEVVILRTGTRLKSDYEWSHHVVRARACGMSDRRILSIAGSLDTMAEDDRVLSRAVDELTENHQMSEASIQAVVGLVGKEGLFDLIATVGFYTTLGFIVKSFATPIDDDIASALKQRPLAADAADVSS
nr:carboxymuconolactone decarboxylase family protein [Rhizobium sp. L1K21]